ncbi:MAG: hypothetical protein QM572_08855 [Nocardioides sp.]|uniref:hypothetical protein n=1 Tax=Nocardioides sp. TaxID=35761 RepID=UPI0039E64C77
MSNKGRKARQEREASRERARVMADQLAAVRHTRQWIIGLATLCATLGATYLYLNNVGGDPVERDANLQVTSGQGNTSWRLARDFGGMPILCGCADPTGHDLGIEGGTPWEGTLIPADQFTMSLEDGQPWALQAIAPDSGPAAWLGAGIVPLNLRVTVQGTDGVGYQSDYSVTFDKTKLLSSNGVYGLTLDGFDSVDVDVEDQWPLVSVMSPSGSSSAVHVESGARPYEPAAAGLIIDVLAQSAHGAGMFLNVANESTLTAVAGRNARVIVGTRLVDHVVPGASVEIVVSSPIGPAQLMAFPTTSAWRHRLDALTTASPDVTVVDHTTGDVPDPHAVDPPTADLPASRIRLDSILTPSESSWQAFLKRTTPKDPDEPTGLPPLPSDRRIEIFGPIEELQSRAMSGSVSVGNESWAITQADDLQLRSSEGISSGPWTPSLGLSVGSAPVETTISTKADVSVGGAPVTLTDRADGWASAVLNVLLLLAGTAVGLLPEWRRLRREEIMLRGGGVR